MAPGSAMPSRRAGDVDAVALLDDVAQMDADAELDAALRRQAGVALDDRVLDLDRAAHGVDDAAELDQGAVARALHDAAVVKRDRGIDQIAAQRPQPRQRALLIRTGEPAEPDPVGGQDRRQLPLLGHRQFLPRPKLARSRAGRPIAYQQGRRRGTAARPRVRGARRAGRVERLLELPVCRYDWGPSSTKHTSGAGWHG